MEIWFYKKYEKESKVARPHFQHPNQMVNRTWNPLHNRKRGFFFVIPLNAAVAIPAVHAGGATLLHVELVSSALLAFLGFSL